MRRWLHLILATLLLPSLALPAGAQPVAAEPAAQTQPAAQLSAADRERFDRLISLIEGQNTPDARRTGVRELLLQPWPQVPVRLAAILSGSNVAARTAVAAALAEAPQHLDATYLEPLTRMLALEDEAARVAAAAALSGYPGEQGIAQLRAFLLDRQQPLPARLQVIDALSSLGRRATVAVLVELLDVPEVALQEQALLALDSATGLDFGGDREAVLRWWTGVRDLPPAEWLERQIKVLLTQDRRREQELRELEARLARSLRTAFQRTPEAERTTVLQGYLGDPLGAVQLLGLELVLAQVSEGKTLVPELASVVRGLMTSANPAVRAAAIRAVAGLRDPADGDSLLAMLGTERKTDVRLALVNGLGYVGASSAVPALLALLPVAETRLQAELLTALGRLAEREMLDETVRPEVVRTLLDFLAHTDREATVLRERVLWAMGRVADPVFADAFAEALNAGEGVGVRQAAVRGLAVLDDPKQADVLIAASADPDVTVRRQAVELLARWAAADTHVQALFNRLATAQESDEGIRGAAWEGVVRVLSSRAPAEIDRWIAQLPENGAARAERTVRLLRLQEQQLRATATPVELGQLRLRIARQLAAAGDVDGGVAAYREALAGLHAGGAAQASEAAGELLRLALTQGRYTEALATGLRELNPPLDGAALLDVVRPLIEERLTRDKLEQALPLVTALRDWPPTAWPEPAAAALNELYGAARRLEAEVDAERVTAVLAARDANPEDAAAVEAVAKLTAALRDRLQAVLEREPLDTAEEQRLYDLLRQLAPQWPGFAAGAGQPEKLAALEALRS
jgi:HEAT repeat protein